MTAGGPGDKRGGRGSVGRESSGGSGRGSAGRESGGGSGGDSAGRVASERSEHAYRDPHRDSPPSRAAFTERGSTKPCAFCAIVRHEASAHEVYRDETFVAFLDAHPVFRGHVLMVPVEHVQTYDELPSSLAAGWVDVSQRLQRAVESAMGADGSLLIVNNVVSQSVPHLHLHVIPRSRGDGLRFWLGPRRKYADAADAEDVAARIRAAVGAGG